MYGSKNSKSRRTSKLYDPFKSYNDIRILFHHADYVLRVQMSLLRVRELAGEGLWLWLLALVTVNRCHVTCDMCHLTPDMKHVKHDL